MPHACRCRTTSVRRCVSEHRPGRADVVRGLDHAAPAGPSGAARAGSPVGRHRGYGRAPRAWPGEVHGATGQGCSVRRGLRGARDSVPERRASLVADELGGREPQLHRVCDPHRGRAARGGYAVVAAGAAAGRGPLDLEAAAADREGHLSACASGGDALDPQITTQVAATVRTVLPDLLYSLLTQAW